MSIRIRPMSETYIANILNINGSISMINDSLKKPEKYALTNDHMLSIMNDFKYKINLYGKEIVLAEIEKGNISLQVVPGVPLSGWVVPDSSVDEGLLGIGNLFGKVNIKSPTMAIYQPRPVFGAALFAFILRGYYLNTNKVLFNTQLTTSSTIVYTRMMMQVIDMMFATSSIPLQSAAISYSIAKFYLKYVMGSSLSDTLIESIALKVAKNQSNVSESAIKEAGSKIPEVSYSNLKDFITTISNEFSVIKALDVNAMLRKMISLYGEKSVMMVESHYIFLAYTICSTYSSEIIKDFIFERVSGKEGQQIAATYINMMR